MEILKIILGFLFIGWIINICKAAIIYVVESVEDRDFTFMIVPATIAISCLITWWLYHMGYVKI